MDLNTITEVVRPRTRAELPSWQAGDAWLAGGTWLFSEPQARLSRLVDLNDLAWPSLVVSDQGLCIAATCSVAALDALPCPTEWIAAPLIDQCCRAFLASFKIWKTATVGGNLCMSLPAGPMISLLAALEGVCTIWKNDGGEQRIGVTDFVTGNNRNVLAPGDLLRQIDVPLAALKRRAAFRQIALSPVGRSGALLIGTSGRDGDLLLTVTGSTIKPLKLHFASMPDATLLRARIFGDIPDTSYHDDVHGKPAWRKAMTLRLAEEIRAELAGGTRP
jgi:CO/xanthine dehydrogenase FAD-binding subunit